MMVKKVGLSGELHGTLSASFDSPGMAAFSQLNPGEKAMLMSRLADPAARAKLAKLAGAQEEEPMALLILAIERAGIDAVKNALGGR